MSKALIKAISVAGGAARLAERIGASPQMICNWKRRGRVPPQHCVAIEEAVGRRVTRQELRPDIFG